MRDGLLFAGCVVVGVVAGLFGYGFVLGMAKVRREKVRVHHACPCACHVLPELAASGVFCFMCRKPTG